jgi:hypothetical protein
MSLTADERVLYARHRLLSEIGDTGQERLLATRVELTEGADPGVAAVARRYLDRAGVGARATTGITASAATSSEVVAIAGDPSLRPAAEALLGALAAVSAIRDALGKTATHRDVPTLSGRAR